MYKTDEGCVFGYSPGNKCLNNCDHYKLYLKSNR